MHRRTTFVLLIWLSGLPLLAAPGTLVKLPSSPGDAVTSCSRMGAVMGRDMFDQSFLLKQDNGWMETVPFSRWTAFFKISPGSSTGTPRGIEPTDIRLGDRLCVLLDATEATAKSIIVVEPIEPPPALIAARN